MGCDWRNGNWVIPPAINLIHLEGAVGMRRERTIDQPFTILITLRDGLILAELSLKARGLVVLVRIER